MEPIQVTLSYWPVASAMYIGVILTYLTKINYNQLPQIEYFRRLFNISESFSQKGAENNLQTASFS